jgi:predicted PurR-regulated permease PerM
MGKKAQLFVIPLKAEKLLEVGLARLPENLLGVAHFGLWIFIIPFVTFFALIDGPIWIDTLFNVTPSEYVESLLGLLAEINETLGAYIRGQLLDAICVGSLTIIGLSILGVNGAVLLGTLTGFFNVVPFMAPVVGGGLALLAAAYQGLDGGTLLGVVILFGAMRILDDFVFIPFIIGSKIQLHPVVILFAVLSGFQVGGFLGLVFSIPMAAVIKVGLSVILNKKRESNLYNQKHVLS